MLIRFLSFLVVLLLLNGCAIVQLGDHTPPELVSAAGFLSQGKTVEAAAQFDAVIRSRPHDQATYLRIADLCNRKGAGELAVRYAEQGLAETSQDDNNTARSDLYLLASMGYELTGDSANAIRTAHEANKLMPEDPATLNGLGYAYAQAGQNLDEALKLTTRAVELARRKNAPDELVGSIIDSLGWTYFKMGNSEEALRYLSSAADLVPGSWEIHEHLSQVYTSMGKTKDAGIERDRAAKIREAQRLKSN